MDWLIEESSPTAAVGISLGGNALLKWLGERGEAAKARRARAAAVSAPIDLPAAGAALDRGLNRLIYTRYFLATLRPKSLAKLERFPGLYDAAPVRAARRFRDFDNAVTAPLHGFRDADHYWSEAASGPWLEHIRVPTLVLNARNDPSSRSMRSSRPRESRAMRGARISAHRRPRRIRVRPVPGPSPLACGAPSRVPRTVTLPAEIFRAYDIRGIVGRTLTVDAVREIGRALGTLARERGAATFAVCRDGRLSGPELSNALMEGLNAAGADAIDIGMGPTPLAYFAAHHLGCGSCVAVSGSHNPPSTTG